MLVIEFKRGRGDVKEGLLVNSDEFLRRWTRGVLTLKLTVTVFQMGCGQTDLASACVLHPLNRLILDFKTGGLTE